MWPILNQLNQREFVISQLDWLRLGQGLPGVGTHASYRRNPRGETTLTELALGKTGWWGVGGPGGNLFAS